MSRATITSLAILKINYERQGRDYIQNFVPFVAECLAKGTDDVVSLPILQNSLLNEFGLRLPLNPLKQILKRAAHAGFVRRESGMFYRNTEECVQTAFSDTRAAVQDTCHRVITALQSFVRENFAVEWTDDHTNDALLAFVGESGIDILYSSAERSVIPGPVVSKDSRYMVARFIANCRSSNTPLMQDVETIIKGAILADALYLPDPGRVAQRFRYTRVYFDTSFLVYALGYAGDDRKAPCAELLELLNDHGADLGCLQITVNEIRGILDACSIRIRRGQLRDAYGPTIEYFVARGHTSTDIDLLSANLTEKLKFIGLKIEDKPAYTKEFVIDEAGFAMRLKQEIGYRNERALDHDVDCISAMARHRAETQPFDIETCKAIFVTTNNDLARVTRQYFQHESSPGVIALCITDYALGNLLWLKSPTKSPDLPRLRLIADVFAAMEPPDQLWRAYLAEIARLEDHGVYTADDYYLLRYSLSARTALMEITKGDPSAFSEGTVAEILEVSKQNLRADLQHELQDERSQRNAIEIELAKARAIEADRLDNIHRTVLVVADIAAKGAFAIAAVVLAIGSLFTFPWPLPAFSQAWIKYVISLSQLTLLLFGLANVAMGTSLHSACARLRDTLATSVEGLILRTLDK